MAYSDYTIAEVQKRLGLTIDDRGRNFEDCPPVDVPQLLTTTVRRNLSLARNSSTEKAKSELLISPVLVELKHQFDETLSLFSGVEFNVDAELDLNGRCDFILSRSPLQLSLTTPICMIVEAKSENILAGIPQCLAEMAAAQRFNGNLNETIYGVVTSGLIWRFIKLDGSMAVVDEAEYSIEALSKIYAILTRIGGGK